VKGHQPDVPALVLCVKRGSGDQWMPVLRAVPIAT